MIQNGENLDIRNIAEKNYTSISSISRLVKRTGLKNYKEFIYYLQQIVKNKTDHQLSELPFATTTSNWEDIGQQLQTAFKEIYTADGPATADNSRKNARRNHPFRRHHGRTEAVIADKPFDRGHDVRQKARCYGGYKEKHRARFYRAR